MIDPHSVLVFGASCQVGHFLLPLLRANAVQAYALSRGAQAGGEGTVWYRGALPDAVPQMPPVDGIVSFGPLDALAEWLRGFDARPAPVLVATSSMSVLSKQHSPLPGERALVERLHRGEENVRVQCERLGIAWTLIRPTLIYGAGLDRSLTPIARRAMRWRVFPLPAARGWRQPVHAADVAEAAWRALRTPAAAGRVFELGGGERLRAQDMFDRVRTSLPARVPAVPLGETLLSALALVMPRARGPVSRLHRDLVADNAAVVDVLGLTPRGFRPDAATWGLGGGAT